MDDIDYEDFDVQGEITDFSSGAVILEGESSGKFVEYIRMKNNTEVSDRVAVGQEALTLVQNETCREVLKGELAEVTDAHKL